jgi:hypothetical protein
VNKTVEELLAEIERLSRGLMSEARIAEVENEVRAHLDAAVQARLELGLSVGAAEQDAVASFGCARDFVAQLNGAESAKFDSRFDPGVCVALLVSTLLIAGIFDFVTLPIPQEFTYPIILLLGIPLYWRSWRATRPQVLPLIFAFLISIPIFAADFPINGAKFRFHFEWGMGADGSATTIGIWGFCSLVSWLVGSIVRGNIGRDLRSLRAEHRAMTPRWRDALLLAGCMVIAIGAGVAESLSQHYTPAQLWTGFAILIPTVVAAFQGWQWGKLHVRSLLLGAAVSIPLAIVVLSAIFVVVPSFGEVIFRSEVSSWVKSPDVDWQQSAKAELDKVVDRAQKDISSHAPPYKVPLSVVVDGYSNAPFRTAQSRDQAFQMLSEFKYKQERRQQKQEAIWADGLKIMAQYRKEEIASLNAPLVVNALRLSPLTLFEAGSLWLLMAAAQGLGAMAKFLLRRRIGSKRGFEEC